jgi:predicted nuclease of predicted toxin-antitoxin system
VKVWLDAQLPPALCSWLHSEFAIEAEAIRDLGLRDAEDLEIFEAAREAGVAVMSKDADFVELVRRHGPPPQVLWVTFGNTSNREIRRLLSATLPDALQLLRSGEALVEVSKAR